jgi:hypothetical protein
VPAHAIYAYQKHTVDQPKSQASRALRQGLFENSQMFMMQSCNCRNRGVSMHQEYSASCRSIRDLPLAQGAGYNLLRNIECTLCHSNSHATATTSSVKPAARGV